MVELLVCGLFVMVELIFFFSCCFLKLLFFCFIWNFKFKIVGKMYIKYERMEVDRGLKVGIIKKIMIYKLVVWVSFIVRFCLKIKYYLNK